MDSPLKTVEPGSSAEFRIVAAWLTMTVPATCD
jgi:hypothetical protein